MGNGGPLAINPRDPRALSVLLLQLDFMEPMHVHVERDDATCKFWLQPLTLAANAGFSPRELNRIRRIIQDHLEAMTDAWNQHCGSA